mgnify:CR=1 FL=1
MITRNVHNHEAETEIKNNMFNIFITNKKSISNVNKNDIMNI